MTTAPTTGKSRIDYTASGKALQTQADNGPHEAINRHKSFLNARSKQIAGWVTQGVKPEALVRFALLDMDGERGARLRECTPQSIYLGLLACAVTGLEPGALRGEAYLVPYRNKNVMEATFMPGWKGLVKQARRSRELLSITPQVVFERDLFDIDLGTANVLIHKPALKERGDIIGAYAIARLANGGHEIEWMDREDLEAVRKAGSNGPAWGDWADQMYRKAPIRRLCKRLPMGADYFVGLALERAAEDGRGQRQVLDIEAPDAAARQGLDAVAAPAIDVPAGDQPSREEMEEMERADRDAARR